MKLRIDDGEDIAVPSCLADSNLTLSEIGALVCLTAMSETGEGLQRLDRGDADFLDALKSLKAKKIVTMSLSGNNLSIHIDLDNIESAEKEGL